MFAEPYLPAALGRISSALCHKGSKESISAHGKLPKKQLTESRADSQNQQLFFSLTVVCRHKCFQMPKQQQGSITTEQYIEAEIYQKY